MCAVASFVFANSENSWVEKAPLQAERGRLGVAAVNGRIYAIGGSSGRLGGLIGPYVWSGGGPIVNTVEEYDPDTDVWTFKTSMPTLRDHFGIAVYENKIYCIGGESPNSNGRVANEVYDPAADTWESKASMPNPGRFQMANTVNGKIYVVGAVDSDSLTQVYDPATDSWTAGTPPPYKIWSTASAVVDNKIYFRAGNYTNSAPTSPPSFTPTFDAFLQIYDTETDTWSMGAAAPSYMTVAVAGVTSGTYAPKRIYFFDENATYVYNPQNNNWTSAAAKPTARGFAGVAVIDDVFYVVGGVTFPSSGVGEMAPTAANEQYTPIGYVDSLPPSPSPTMPEMTMLSAIPIGVAVTCAVMALMRKKNTGSKTHN